MSAHRSGGVSLTKHIGLWFRDVLIRRKSMNATRIVAGGFAIIILLGTLLLMLPVASQSGQSAGFLTSLFTATSATCVTGLVPVDTGMSWTFFGQLVIILLIQVGGLGFMTVLSLFSLLLRRRIGLSERLIMASTLNLNDMDGVVRVVRHALMVTFTLEGIGAVVQRLRGHARLGNARRREPFFTERRELFSLCCVLLYKKPKGDILCREFGNRPRRWRC